MKKLLALIFAGVIACSMAGCGETESNPSESPSASPVTESVEPSSSPAAETDAVSISNEADISDDLKITYINTRNASTPTGVILNIAPYILMVALAGVLAFFFLRKRHYEM